MWQNNHHPTLRSDLVIWVLFNLQHFYTAFSKRQNPQCNHEKKHAWVKNIPMPNQHPTKSEEERGLFHRNLLFVIRAKIPKIEFQQQISMLKHSLHLIKQLLHFPELFLLINNSVMGECFAFPLARHTDGRHYFGEWVAAPTKNRRTRWCVQLGSYQEQNVPKCTLGKSVLCAGAGGEQSICLLKLPCWFAAACPMDSWTANLEALQLSLLRKTRCPGQAEQGGPAL